MEQVSIPSSPVVSGSVLLFKLLSPPALDLWNVRGRLVILARIPSTDGSLQLNWARDCVGYQENLEYICNQVVTKRSKRTLITLYHAYVQEACWYSKIIPLVRNALIPNNYPKSSLRKSNFVDNAMQPMEYDYNADHLRNPFGTTKVNVSSNISLVTSTCIQLVTQLVPESSIQVQKKKTVWLTDCPYQKEDLFVQREPNGYFVPLQVKMWSSLVALIMANKIDFSSFPHKYLVKFIKNTRVLLHFLWLNRQHLGLICLYLRSALCMFSTSNWSPFKEFCTMHRVFRKEIWTLTISLWEIGLSTSKLKNLLLSHSFWFS